MTRLVTVIAMILLSCVGCGQPAHPTGGGGGAALFDFHSSAWVNLHGVLYAEGLKRKGKEAPELVSIDDPAWDAAVDVYASTVSLRDLTLDDDLAAINEKISRLGDAADPAGAGLPADLSKALSDAMPLYRARAWAQHDKSNAAWLAATRPYLDEHGAAIAHELARLFRTEWPKEPLRVDVVAYANWAGAYTNLGPPHLTISSLDARNQPPAELEILFHEASHVIIRPVREAIAKELEAQHKSARDLWHALLFFTSGEVVKKRLGADYVPYAYRNGLYDRGWGAFRKALEQHWVPYLQGRVTFDAAIHDVVKAL